MEILSQKQKIELLEAYIESENPQNLIPLEQIMKTLNNKSPHPRCLS